MSNCYCHPGRAGGSPHPLGLTLRVLYPSSTAKMWDKSHPAGRAIVRCFDDIAEFSERWSLQVAIVFYVNCPSAGNRRMSEIVADLCAERGLCFLDTWDSLNELKVPSIELQASASDTHPSAKAHQAVARHLVKVLWREGWFEKYADRAIVAAPDRIIQAARAMVGKDHYPLEVACNWALGALDAKSRLAARMEAMDGPLDFSSAAEPVASELVAARTRWHITQSLRAFVQATAFHGPQSPDTFLNGIFFERLTVEEVCFALDMNSWEETCASSIDLGFLKNVSEPASLFDAPALLAGCEDHLQRARTGFDSLRSAIPDSPLGWPRDESLLIADLEILDSVFSRLEFELVLLKRAFSHAQEAYRDLSAALSREREEQLSGLLGNSLRMICSMFSILRQWSVSIQRMSDQHRSEYTTVEITLSAGPTQDRRAPVVAARLESHVPCRLPFAIGARVSRSGAPSLIRFTFPTFYSGVIRIIYQVPILRETPAQGINLLKVEVYNRDDQRHSIDPRLFTLLPGGALQSPPIHVF